MVEAAGIEPKATPSPTSDTSATETAQIRAISAHGNKLQDRVSGSPKQNPAFPEHNKGISTQQKCVPGVYQNTPIPDDLAQVVDAWDNLPKPVKAGILAMVREAQK